METIPILYRIAEDDGTAVACPGSNITSDINCFELKVPARKEVMLVDILDTWIKTNPIGIHFRFYARASGDKMILLESPTCCVPVINNTIYLILKPSGHMTYTPPHQSITWFEKSQYDLRDHVYNAFHWITSVVQRDVYGRSTINIMDRYRHLQSNRQHKTQQQQHNEEQRQQQQEQQHHQRQQSLDDPSVDDYFHCEDNSSQRKGDRDRDRERDRDRDREKHDHNFHDASRVLADATHTTVAAAGTAAKSFFSFASSTIKTVASVTAQGLEAGSELASVGIGMAATTLSGAVTVGSYKVSVVRDLAEGGFGKVVLVKDAMAGSEQGKEYALKILLCQTKEQVKDVQNEIRVLKKFRGHPNIIGLMDHSSHQKGNGQHVYHLLFPVYPMGTAWDLIERHSNQGGEGRWPFTEEDCLRIVLGAARALGAMHDTKCLHMDMKPHNILLTEDRESVVMDMGSAGPSDVHIASRREALNLEDEADTKCSAPFRAPELYQVPQDFLLGGWVDIWSLGCTMHCLAFGWSPFENAREGVLKLAILNGRYSTPPRNQNCGVTFSQGYTDLIRAMLDVDYTTRPTAQDVKERLKDLLEDI